MFAVFLIIISKLLLMHLQRLFFNEFYCDEALSSINHKYKNMNISYSFSGDYDPSLEINYIDYIELLLFNRGGGFSLQYILNVGNKSNTIHLHSGNINKLWKVIDLNNQTLNDIMCDMRWDGSPYTYRNLKACGKNVFSGYICKYIIRLPSISTCKNQDIYINLRTPNYSKSFIFDVNTTIEFKDDSNNNVIMPGNTKIQVEKNSNVEDASNHIHVDTNIYINEIKNMNKEYENRMKLYYLENLQEKDTYYSFENVTFVIPENKNENAYYVLSYNVYDININRTNKNMNCKINFYLKCPLLYKRDGKTCKKFYSVNSINNNNDANAKKYYVSYENSNDFRDSLISSDVYEFNELIQNLKNGINNEISNNNNEFYIKFNDDVYGKLSFSYDINTENDNVKITFPSNTNISYCEKCIKKIYNISILILLQIDKENLDITSNSVEYTLYSPEKKINIPISECESLLYIPIDIISTKFYLFDYRSKIQNEYGYDFYYENDNFYYDICFPTYNDNIDIPFIKRKDVFYKSIEFCTEDCKYKGINYDSEKVECICDSNKNDFDNDKKNDLIMNINSDINSYLNNIPFLCFKKIIRNNLKQILKLPYLKFSIVKILIFLIIMLLIFMRGLIILESQIYNDRVKKRKQMIHIEKIYDVNYAIKQYSHNDNDEIKYKIEMKLKEKNLNYKIKDNNNETYYKIYNKDNRSFCKIFFSILLHKIELIDIFFLNKNPYSIIYLNIFLYIFSFNFLTTINFLLFGNKIILQIYESNNSHNNKFIYNFYLYISFIDVIIVDVVYNKLKKLKMETKLTEISIDTNNNNHFFLIIGRLKSKKKILYIIIILLMIINILFEFYQILFFYLFPKTSYFALISLLFTVAIYVVKSIILSLVLTIIRKKIIKTFWPSLFAIYKYLEE